MNQLLSLLATLSIGAATFASNSVCLFFLHEIDIPDSVSQLVREKND